MAMSNDLATTFIHLRDGGDAEPIEVTRAFWAGSGGKRYDRVLGAVDFETSADLHASLQEIHPEADEVIVVVSGAIDVVLQEDDTERTIALNCGETAIVPRGIWHRLVVREAGRLLFINSRTGMQSRRTRRKSAGVAAERRN
jgi:mannose-6-phosphate isomerase-like protein (cupin superfamily)